MNKMNKRDKNEQEMLRKNEMNESDWKGKENQENDMKLKSVKKIDLTR